MEAVMSLLTCATLPYADVNSNGNAIDKDSGDINGVEDGGDIDGEEGKSFSSFNYSLSLYI